MKSLEKPRTNKNKNKNKNKDNSTRKHISREEKFDMTKIQESHKFHIFLY